VSVTERPLLQLTIRRQSTTNIVDLNFGEPLIHQSEAQADDVLLQGLDAQFRHLATSSRLSGNDRRGDTTVRESDTVIDDLRGIGQLIFSQLLPETTRQRLLAAEPSNLSLRLDEQLIHLPWELCYDGKDFLATKFCVGRQVITSTPTLKKRTPRTETGPLRVLLVADPTESLPQAVSEAESLCKLLDAVSGVRVTLVGGKLVEKADLLKKLQTHDVVHFAGHSHYDPVSPAKSGWHLDNGVLTAEELSKLQDPPRLVFSNSCQAGATPAWGGRYRYEGQAFGIGSAFLLAGVTNYIGTFWVVHDEESMLFAVAFYQGVATGVSVGAALRQARQEVIRQRGWQGLTWASYMLYGDPTVTLLPQAEEQPRADTSEVAYPRDLVAILSTDVEGYSRHLGQNDIATVETLYAFRELMKTCIQQRQGEVVDSPGDNLLAFFPSVIGAVQCALEIQRELKARNAELPVARKLRYRIGINLGDVIRREEGVHGDGINIAARLEKLAKPGEICISGFVYEQIKNRLHTLDVECEFLGEQRLKNIDKLVPAYRLTLEPGPRPFGFFWVLRVLYLYTPSQRKWAGVGVLVGLVAVLLYMLVPPPPPRAVVVMPFKVLRVNPQLEAIAEAILHHFNSQLSRAPHLRVYSKEHFDFEIQKRKAPEIAVAKELSIAKMIYGSVLALGSKLRIEAHINNVQSGEMEASEVVDGELEDLFTLTKELVAKLMDRLNVDGPVEQVGNTPEPTSPSLDTYNLLLEAEGGKPIVKSPQKESGPSQSGPSKESEPHSWVPQWRGWLAVSTAFADETSPQGGTPEAEVHQVLEQYRQAYEQKDPELLATVYQTFTPAQQEANVKYFQNTQDLRVSIRDVDITVQGNEAAVSYTREDEFLDAKTGQKVKLDARFTKIFVRQDGGWKMVVGKK
jgi:class 3 adenylate cyclase/TolB-like protein